MLFPIPGAVIPMLDKAGQLVHFLRWSRVIFVHLANLDMSYKSVQTCSNPLFSNTAISLPILLRSGMPACSSGPYSRWLFDSVKTSVPVRYYSQ